MHHQQALSGRQRRALGKARHKQLIATLQTKVAELVCRNTILTELANTLAHATQTADHASPVHFDLDEDADDFHGHATPEYFDLDLTD
eukprot:2290717-Karenia_brevis.AAC.1